MIQFLHIFKKDVRRHWPEILISLALLAIYAHHEMRPWSNPLEYDSISPLFFLLSGRYLPFFLALSWIFLILRVVHSETLVGDRQWWVTKPYVWRQLLLSKLFFIFVVIWVPLFHVQLFLLHHAGFSTPANLGRLLLMQFTLPFVLFICGFALASLTKNLAQALLGIGMVIVVFIVGLWADSASSHMTGDSSHFMDVIESFLFFSCIIVVPVWQFARRRTSASRMIAGASLGASAILSFIPFSARVEQSYPLVARDSPAEFTIPPIHQLSGNQSALAGFTSDTQLSIPVNISGVAPGSVILIDGMKIAEDLSGDSRWAPGWVTEYRQLWPGSQRQTLGYQVKRKSYEEIKAKPLNLRIELALSEYQEVGSRTLILPAGTFRDADLGTCRVLTMGYQLFECRKPFQSPAYIGRFDSPNSPCGSVQRYPNSAPTNLEVAYAWSRPTEEVFPDPGLNPIVEYQVSFNPAAPITDAEAASRVQLSVPELCPGAELHLGHPAFKRHVRVRLELPSTRLEDLVERGSF